VGEGICSAVPTVSCGIDCIPSLSRSTGVDELNLNSMINRCIGTKNDSNGQWRRSVSVFYYYLIKGLLD